MDPLPIPLFMVTIEAMVATEATGPYKNTIQFVIKRSK